MRRNARMVLVAALLYLLFTSSALGAAVLFKHNAPGAKNVYLAGSFNNWDASSHPMELAASGFWELVLQLDEGSYQYKFAVDGQWYSDPEATESADDGYGGQNSGD